MKLQGLSVFFCLIAVPIVLVMTYYIQAQVNTIALQMSYDTKLLDATHDSLVALEINTANEDLSNVSDSLRSIIKASTNIFTNTLATNLGMSNATKSALQPYIPAMLFSLYDGYYIYSPTRVPVVCTDEHGVAIYVGDKGVETAGGTTPSGLTKYKYTPGSDVETSTTVEEDYGMLLYKVKGEDTYVTAVDDSVLEFKTDYVLKSYVPYAARYKDGSNLDIQINYTLDNYVNIYGTINGVYYTKSGYYTNFKIDNCISPVGNALIYYGDEEIEEFCNNKANQIELDVVIDGETYHIKTTDDETGGSSQAREAIKYYLKSYSFSEWVRKSLNGLEECHIQERISNEIDGGDDDDLYKKSLFGDDDSRVVETDLIVKFKDKHGRIFDINQNPESDDSTFVNHKHEVMKNSMQYNLNLAMSTYNEMNMSTYSFHMPVVDEETWGRVTSRVSVLAFMQGFKCGLKTYNNYACVSSTNNEFTVLPEEIYYVGTPDGTVTGASGLDDANTQYHRINCPKFNEMLDSWSVGDDTIERNISSFVSKEIKYDKIYSKLDDAYLFDHKNLACYTCIISGNYKTDVGGVEEYRLFDFNNLSDKAKETYIIALGKEREELYKTNQIINNQGVSLNNTSSEKIGPDQSVDVILADTSKKLADIDSIEITISNVQRVPDAANPSNVYPYPVAYARVKVNGSQDVPNADEADGYYRIVNQQAKQTIVLQFKSNETLLNDITNSLTKLQILMYEDTGEVDGAGVVTVPATPANLIKYNVDTIKINYKS